MSDRKMIHLRRTLKGCSHVARDGAGNLKRELEIMGGFANFAVETF